MTDEVPAQAFIIPSRDGHIHVDNVKELLANCSMVLDGISDGKTEGMPLCKDGWSTTQYNVVEGSPPVVLAVRPKSGITHHYS